MKAVLASPAQLSALRRAFAPAYAALRKDNATSQMIDAVKALERQVKPTSLAIPKSCRARRSLAQTGSSSSAAFPKGVYRTRTTKADLLRVWPDADANSIRLFVGTVTTTWRDGTFSTVRSGGGVPGCRHGDGRFSGSGRVVTVTWTNFHGCKYFHAPTDPVKLRWSYDGKALRFRVVGSAEPVDRVSWETNPFVRIG